MHGPPAQQQPAIRVSAEQKNNHFLIDREPQIEEEIKQQDQEVEASNEDQKKADSNIPKDLGEPASR